MLEMASQKFSWCEQSTEHEADSSQVEREIKAASAINKNTCSLKEKWWDLLIFCINLDG